jgi:hypothetical protein
MGTAAELGLLVAVDEDNAFLLSFPDHGLGETASTGIMGRIMGTRNLILSTSPPN